ncbi:serine protease [Bacteriovorax sp. Seq25_V]|uniref:trypsin-like serine peptidase n=1 Tax=Bacteriovorax sp. Seq25_V TaxID=1201288 RepID=UPI000389EDF7|nr:serine protease [Bacteriovorax sp. Seq25_V]EQC44217.1 trypsin [Bacteriovorax sp. Seq25_V]
MRTTLLVLLLAFTNSVIAKNKAIYGEFNVFHTETSQDISIRKNAKATALVVNKFSIEKITDNLFAMNTKTLGQRAPLCEGNPWKDEIALGSCSSFLISKDTIVTAGHCVQNAQWDCNQKSFIFNVESKFFTSTKKQYFRKSDVYTCSKILAHEIDADSGIDLAVIKLDREVEGVTPLKLSRTGDEKLGTSITMIGNPLGLSSMTSENGRIRAFEENFYVADLDSFAGNSGAPVFKNDSNDVIGVLVRGEEDFEYNEETDCFEQVKCLEGECRGEDIVKASSVLKLIEKI